MYMYVNICAHTHIHIHNMRLCVYIYIYIYTFVCVQPQVALIKNQGLERNAVEHASDIADALQQRLSVCLRCDRSPGIARVEDPSR